MKNSDLLDAVVNTVGVASMVFGLVVIFLLLLREGERTTRAQIRAACPSGTAERVCEQAEAEMSREPFGRACVRFSRWMGGEK